MVIACTTMVLSLQKFRYMYYLQWDSTRKAPTALGELYYGGIGRDYGTIFINMVVNLWLRNILLGRDSLEDLQRGVHL